MLDKGLNKEPAWGILCVAIGDSLFDGFGSGGSRSNTTSGIYDTYVLKAMYEVYL